MTPDPTAPSPAVTAAAAGIRDGADPVHVAPGAETLTPAQQTALQTAILDGGPTVANLRIVVLPASARPDGTTTCDIARQVGTTAYPSRDDAHHVAVVVGTQSCAYYGADANGDDTLADAAASLSLGQRGDLNALLTTWVSAESTANTPDPPADIPWATVGAASGGLVAAVLITTASIAAAKTALRRTAARHDRQTADAAATTARDDLLTRFTARHDKILADWAGHELDMVSVFQRPLLSDISVPQTAAFHETQSLADDARDAATANPTDKAVDAYGQAVRELEHDWKAAWAHADKIGHAYLPETERTTVRRAVALLRKAVDERAPQPERHACYEQAMHLVQGIITVPRKTAQAVEQSTRLAIAPTTTPTTTAVTPARQNASTPA